MSGLCVVFDIDDTLYLERDYVVSGFAALGPWAHAWLGVPDFAERCRKEHDSGTRGRIFNKVLDDCGFAPSAEVIGTLIALYRAHVPDIRLCKDAASALEEISRTCPIAIITDGPAISQSRKAEALQLSRFAAPICLTELYGTECSKPSPVAFERVQRTIGASRFVYIADNPVKDFTAPATLGWDTIRVRRPGGIHYELESVAVKPDFEFPDCTELPRLLSAVGYHGVTG
jgi:putative hydrolase of the HAD superfamily